MQLHGKCMPQCAAAGRRACHAAACTCKLCLTCSPVCAAEGLHLIDFEQLKIENQSLNEKIEERNEELVKLRKKTTVTVQVSTATL